MPYTTRFARSRSLCGVGCFVVGRMISLRPYQNDAHNATRASMEAGRRAPLIVLPCGSGKTVIFCDYTQKANAKGKNVLILSHRDELVQQISDTLEAFGVEHSFIAATRPYNVAALTQVASIMSLVSRLKDLMMPDPRDRSRLVPYVPDLIIIDEAHHGVAGSWKAVLHHFARVRRIGVTATPQRLSGEPLGDIFDDLIVGPTAGDLISMGMLSPYVVVAPPVPSTEGLGHKYGDYKKADLKKWRKPKVVGDAVANYVRHGAGKRAVVFEITVEMAKEAAEQFQAAGFRAACLDGSMRPAARRETVQMYRDGFIDVLTTCDLVSEGFDLPAIEVAICLRPTESLALWIQQFGRALRIHPGKERAIILDHAGNTMKHLWLPEIEVEWSLDGSAKMKSKDDSGPAIRQCPFCFAAQFRQAGVNACSNCGTLFAAAGTPRSVEREAGELVELDVAAVARKAVSKRIEQGRAQTFIELVEVFRRYNEQNPVGHAKIVWQARLAKQERMKRERDRQLRMA